MRKIIKIFIVSFFLYYMESFATEHGILQYMAIDKAEELATNTRLTPLFSFSFGKEINIKDELINSLHRISENEIGRSLLKRLAFLIKTIKEFDVGNYDGFIHIMFNDGKGTYFSGKGYKPETNRLIGGKRMPIHGQNMSISLNLDFNNKSIIFNPMYGLGSIIPAIKSSDSSKFCEIGHCFDPFWITVAHELIHMEHFLTEEFNKYVKKYIYGSMRGEDIFDNFASDESLSLAKSKIETLNKFRGSEIDIFENLPTQEIISQESLKDYCNFLNNPLRFHARYSANKKMIEWENLSKVIFVFPELAARKIYKGSLSFFLNLEERETVIGDRCSELTIRMAEWEKGNFLPIRYLYQDSDTFFLEDSSVILEIINKTRTTSEIPQIKKEDLQNTLRDSQYLTFSSSSFWVCPPENR